MADSDEHTFWDRDDATAKDRWQTPGQIVDALQKHVDIRLDPCAGLYTFIGEENWTIEEDGEVYRRDGRVLRTGIDSLQREWDTGGIAYVNPPFSIKEEFIDKTLEEIEKGNIDGAIILTPDSTGVRSWWHGKLRPASPAVWFSDGRISFIDPDTGERVPNPTHGTALHFVGPLSMWPDSLFEELNKHGEVMVSYEDQ